MFRFPIVLTACCALIACGSPAPSPRATFSASPPTQFASGPIATACLQADRRAASRGLCGCVQAAADMTLSGADQSRGARYFRDPAILQDVRQSDDRSDERFWTRWKVFVEQSESLCSST